MTEAKLPAALHGVAVLRAAAFYWVGYGPLAVKQGICAEVTISLQWYETSLVFFSCCMAILILLNAGGGEGVSHSVVWTVPKSNAEGF